MALIDSPEAIPRRMQYRDTHIFRSPLRENFFPRISVKLVVQNSLGLPLGRAAESPGVAAAGRWQSPVQQWRDRPDGGTRAEYSAFTHTGEIRLYRSHHNWIKQRRNSFQN